MSVNFVNFRPFYSTLEKPTLEAKKEEMRRMSGWPSNASLLLMSLPANSFFLASKFQMGDSPTHNTITGFLHYTMLAKPLNHIDHWHIRTIERRVNRCNMGDWGTRERLYFPPDLVINKLNHLYIYFCNFPFLRLPEWLWPGIKTHFANPPMGRGFDTSLEIGTVISVKEIEPWKN